MKCSHENLKAAVQKCSVKKGFLEISQNSQENTCARVSFLMNFVEFLRKSFYIAHLWWLFLKIHRKESQPHFSGLFFSFLGLAMYQVDL